MTGLKKHLRAVKRLIEKNEVIAAVVQGNFESYVRGRIVIREGILVATDKRIVFYAQTLFGYDFESIYYHALKRIEGSKSGVSKNIVLVLKDRVVKMQYIRAGEIDVFFDTVNLCISPRGKKGLGLRSKLRPLKIGVFSALAVWHSRIFGTSASKP